MQDFQTRWLAPLALAMTLFALAGKAAADDNLYRAELVLFERIGASDDLAEQMQTRQPQETPDVTRNLWVTNTNGQVVSDLSLVPRNQLYLSSAASRLENSGGYRILMATGWTQSFPPDYKGEPMRIELGDVIDSAGDRAVEGYIDIDRVRYLHVTAHLNQWQAASTDRSGQNDATADGQGQDLSDNPYLVDGNQDAATEGNGQPGQAQPQRELLTWLHQTRRMRSKEIHYLDSPTLGLLIYFQPLDAQ
ncbi:CsiV family protein [Marinobacter bohaiensis]|uniref:CsiV family protein n=1 Tax=Marinobacter bohaiensis TaxID=2201898 RepID=UPI000DAD8BC8|nr:CsiV family protein [Marinobacter bohaiensis]